MRGVLGRAVGPLLEAFEILQILWRRKDSPQSLIRLLSLRKHAAAVIRSGLFDPAFYRGSGDGSRLFRRRPFLHYLLTEPTAGGDPHPLFDTPFYLKSYPDVALSRLNPLVHFVLHGAVEGRDPSLVFDTSFYLEKNPDVVTSGVNPLSHFILHGAREGRDPSLWFGTSFYLEKNPDVAASGVNPLVHFVQVGMWERRDPFPLFNTEFYLSQIGAVIEPGVSPIAHFLTEGGRRGLSPCPLFDPDYYLALYPDVAASCVSPFLHFLETGFREGLKPTPLFDTRFYLRKNLDVANWGGNPLTHFVTSGAAEGRDPHPLFITSFYSRENPDVLSRGLNPLEHFWRNGRCEGRAPNPWHLEAIAVHVWESLRKLPRSGSASSARLPAFTPVGKPRVSVIIPVFNHLDVTLNCLRALTNTTGPDVEIIVMDDHSSDGTSEVLRKLQGIRYIRNEANQGFLRSCNRAANEAVGEYLVFLNNDTISLDDWLAPLLSVFERFPSAGLVGSMLVYPDGTLQEAGGLIWADGSGLNVGRGQSAERPEFRYVREVDYCSAACAMVPARVWRELDGFDETFAPAYYEDTDFCFRLRAAGYRVYYQPASRVVHLEGVTSGTSLDRGAKSNQARNRPVFAERWQEVLGDHGSWSTARAGFRDRYAKHHTLLVDGWTPRPDHDSGSLDTFEYLHYLSEAGHHVVFAPVADWRHDRKYTEKLQQMGVECLYTPFVTSLEDYLEREGGQFDLVFIFRVDLARDLIDCVRRYAPKARVIFVTVDLYSLRASREAALFQDPNAAQRALELRDDEFSIMGKADYTIVVSRHELDMIRTANPSVKVGLVSLGREIPGRSRPFSDRADLVFVGGFRHPPNVDGVRYFVAEVWPLIHEALPNSRFIVAGSNAGPAVQELASTDVIVRGYVEHLEDLFETARLSVAPLRYGAGVKGKVVSSLAHGVPVVGTTLAFEGMALTREDGVFGATDPREMAELAIALYSDEALWNKMSEAGLRAVRRLYSIEAFRAHLADALVGAGLNEN